MINNQENDYYCPKCKEKLGGDEEKLKSTINFVTKYYRLHGAPQHFAITLKRFKMEPCKFRGFRYSKNETIICYEHQLDLTKYFLSKLLFFSPHLIFHLETNPEE